ncbi:hypothetical protein GCM10010389_33480 [Streptomyces echinoruber]|uniref:Uncharacterized protein n=1 Tax=Streptomyces echinoruber TaxID=68898 RepID=A0A918RBD5_9ACTN|nr:hypothetical protein GCM10010389_33480 [Streptomyces echinoruber]
MQCPLRDVAKPRPLGEVTAPTDSSVVADIRERLPAGGATGEEET